MEEKNVFTVIGDDGKEQKCEVLFTFDSDETGKHYIIYTFAENNIDSDGSTKVFASTFDPAEERITLVPIETEKEWKIIEDILDGLQNKDGE